ncbi:MAG: outer membrane lipoprotein-sorting protein [Desulfobacteraceae bacterium]|nr:outer membrane lipoprotein-sorting protein [Desulfobacteraceae bacterium]
MKGKTVLFCLLALLLCQSVYAMTGREIMEKSDALLDPDTAKSKILMLIHKGGKVIEKEFTLQMKQFDNDEDKALISFIRPTKIKLLTHSHKGKDDDQWLRLSSGKVKRIVSSGRDKPFVNSHFYYEDLTSIDIDDYAYKLLGEDKAVGEDCYKVEGVKQIGEKVYDKVIFYVRKSDYFVVRVDFFKKGKFLKFLENYHIKTIDGILTPYKLKMELANGKGKTELVLKGLKYNIDIDNAKFRKEALR